MDNPRRTTRGRAKKVVEIVPTKASVKTSIPVASTASGKRTVTISTADSSVSGKASPGRPRLSPSRRASPGRPRTSPAIKRTSPVRRSSRPRSTIPTVQATSVAAASKLPTTKEDPEVKVSHTHLPTTLTTNTSTRAPNKKTTTSSTQSSYSATTQKTVEIRATNTSDFNKLTDFIRRSASKTFSSTDGAAGLRSNRDGSFTPSQHTDGESHYSRSASRSLYDGDDRYSKAEFSDSETNDENKRNVYDENDEHFKSCSTTSLLQPELCRKLTAPREFGGWFGISLLLILAPSLVYYLHWCCTPQSCKFKMPNFHGILDRSYWFEDVFKSQAVGSYLGFNFSVFVLSALLFGRGVRIPGSAEYKFNAFPMSIVFLLAFAVTDYYGISVSAFVIENYLRFCIYGLLNAYVVALWAYIRADMLQHKDAALFNIYAKSGNVLVDYALGRQLNPKWLGLVEFKQVFYKASLMSTFIYATSLIYAIVLLPLWSTFGREGMDGIMYTLTSLKYDKTAFLCSVMLAIYVYDSIMFEHHLASSFELQGEGFGCLLLLRYAATPYLLSAVARYSYEQRIPLNCTLSAYASLLVLAMGLFLKRISNAIKYKYRIQPNHPHFRHMETIHTFQGKRLLLGPIWGRLRQPNYLGDIIAIIGLGLPLGMRFAWPPLICLALIIVLLVHRCFRVNDRNSSRYYSSWVRYHSMVRNYLVPHIF